MKIKLSFRLVVTLASILAAIFLGLVRVADPQFVEVMRLKYFDQLQKKYPHACEISMGTTNDFEEAIVYGSTMVRIGELIFGKRT